MARGAQIKKEVADKILATFPGSFLYNDGKEIRICGTEDGEEIQVKVTLTAAKENVYPGGENAVPGETISKEVGKTTIEQKTTTEPTQQEMQNVADLLKSLGL